MGKSIPGVSLIRMHLSRGNSRDKISLADIVCEPVPSFSVPLKLGKVCVPLTIMFSKCTESRSTVTNREGQSAMILMVRAPVMTGAGSEHGWHAGRARLSDLCVYVCSR